MKLPRLRTIVLVPLAAFALFYLAGVIVFATRETPVVPAVDAPVAPLTIAILGASGTAGDGILEAALASPDIEKIHVITRRSTPRIEKRSRKLMRSSGLSGCAHGAWTKKPTR